MRRLREAAVTSYDAERTRTRSSAENTPHWCAFCQFREEAPANGVKQRELRLARYETSHGAFRSTRLRGASDERFAMRKEKRLPRPNAREVLQVVEHDLAAQPMTLDG